ncbi:Calmodulin-binding transcription activator 5 [Glycine soja]
MRVNRKQKGTGKSVIQLQRGDHISLQSEQTHPSLQLDLDVGSIMEEARTRWLRPNEIHAMLCNYKYFTINVKPVNLPKSGTIVLFDRKMLRNFRKDGHNWKKKKDGKTVKEAHEHLKVGNEERIHVYYAHGQDNPNFVRRCYWLLDKSMEHIVLVHYREIQEMQGSPVTPVNSHSSSVSDPPAPWILSEEIDSGTTTAYAGDTSANINVKSHELRLHEINTLDWDDLVDANDHNTSTVPNGGTVPYFDLQDQILLNDSFSNVANNLSADIPSFGSLTQPIAGSNSVPYNFSSVNLQTMDDQANPHEQRNNTVSLSGVDSLDTLVNDRLQSQNSFGMWVNPIMSDSPCSVDDPALESPVSSVHEPYSSLIVDSQQSSLPGQVFTITDVSPTCVSSTEKSKKDMREKHVREREKERQGERQALCRGRAPERGRARLLERQRGSLRNREPARDRSYDNNRIYRRSRERGRDRDRRHEEYLPRCRSISRKTRQDETYGSSKGGNQEHNRQDAEPDQEVWTKVIRRREAKAAKKNYTQNRSLHNLSANHPNWRDKEDITSFYFTNFTDNVNEVRLWGKFKIWGDVREVFIAKRRNKEGRRFGFVRFKDVSDVKLLETHLDNIFIDDHKLFVNLPRFTRLASNVHTHTKVDKKEKQSKEAVKDSQATNRPRVRSYVEVVAQKGGLGGTTTAVDGIPTITIVPNKGREVWCKGAWVGRLKKPMQAEKMEDYISWELGYSISARSLGDDIVLITGLSADKAQQLINSETNGGNTLFYSLERWRPGYRVSNRIVWLQVWGFPIEAWEVDHMKQVVSTIGDVIEVDEDTEDRRRLDRARLLVRTPLPPAIIKETIVRCGEEDHRVWLVEEVGDGGDMRRTRLSMSGEWTDEVTSEEEGVAEEDDDGDTAFSYSPELSVTNNNFFLNHQSKVLPSGPCGQTRDRFESVDKSPNPDNCRPNAGGAARHSQGPTLTKADQGYVCAEEMQGNLSPVVITSEPELDVLRKSEEDQNGKVSNSEEPIGQQCITHGDYKTCATDRGDFYDTGHIQGQKNVGPSSTSGLITKLEECKKKKHITMTQTASRNMDGFPKVYARQRNGPLKGCLLKPVAEENTLDMEDKVVPDPKDSFTKGPLSRNRGEMEGEAEEVNSVDGNPLEDLEDANQQWTLAKSLGLQHASDQEGIHSFKNMETRDRKEALQLGNRRKLHVDLLCLQETKKDCLDKASCQFLWGQSDLEWEWQPAINAAGGLLCIWDNNKFQVDFRCSDKDYIMLGGVWLPQMQRVVVVNLYAPCDTAGKRQLWQNLSNRKAQSLDSCWCLVGDFNCIRYPLERQGISNSNPDSQIIEEFNEWLADMGVEDIPCMGKPFTWVRPNGTCKSKLDRIMVSDGWMDLWPDSSQFNLERNFSDHCPILLQSKIIDWGPKPFKVFDGWLKIKEFQQVVKDCWLGYQPLGWGDFVLKTKLKNLKQRLKRWSKENSADINIQIKKLQQSLNEMENSMPSQLSEIQIKQLKDLQSQLWEKASLLESILRQKARSRWVKEGDCNSSYFHKLINFSRRRNAIRGLYIDDAWVEDPSLVKAEVLQHFRNRFHELQQQRPNLDGVHFNALSDLQRDSMTILRSFEMVSGLRINFSKSQFGAVGQSAVWCNSAATYLNCALLQLPFCYLGIPVGANPRRRAVWDPVIRKFEAKLSKWNQRHISMAGRITLINAVLTALPLFFLSFFRAPSAIIHRISTIQRQFLWGGKPDGRKIAWMSWSQCCTPKHMGGLGIRDIQSLNKALLFKWKWMMFHQPDQLWTRILNSKYNGWRGLEHGPRKQYFSTWWADLRAIFQHQNVINADNQIRWKLGRGDKFLFWEDPWGDEGVPLKDQFPELFSISSQRDLTVAEVGSWTENGWVWNMVWRRHLFDNEVQLASKFIDHIHQIRLINNLHDTWIWRAESTGVLTSKSGYQVIKADRDDEGQYLGFKTLWEIKLPPKALSFGWRLLWDRLPTKDNLIKRQIQVLVTGFFHKDYMHLSKSNLLCVCGDVSVPAEIVQVGVYRCWVSPHSPGFVNLYMSIDGHKPISQVVNFEYRTPALHDPAVSMEESDNWDEFQLQMRLAYLLFKQLNLDVISTKVSPNRLKEARQFALKTSFISNSWQYLIKSTEDNQIPFSQAKDALFGIALKSRLKEWLLERIVLGCKTTEYDAHGQSVIHLCAILGYTWAVSLFSWSGLSLDFRDRSGWTALHWAAYCGREKMVATLLSAGAKPNLVTDPTPQNPGGCTAADLAYMRGHDGLAAYLSEKSLVQHFNDMSLAGNISGSLETSTTDPVISANLTEDQQNLKDTLAAYRTAAEAASRIHAAFREHSLKLRTKAVASSHPEAQARKIVAAMKIQHAFRNHKTKKVMAAAARIQCTYRTWKIRKEFLNMRCQAVKIQAAFRCFQVRKHYCKILWSVGVVEKAVLRWRLKRRGFRGLQVKTVEAGTGDQDQQSDVEEEFFRAGRKQAEERVERSVVRVQAMFRSKKAQEEYRRMKLALDQAKAPTHLQY